MIARAASSSGASNTVTPVFTVPSVGPARISTPSASKPCSRSKCLPQASRSASVMVAAKSSRGGCRK
jgi:hypothetical protein